MPDYAASGVAGVVITAFSVILFGIIRLSMRQRNSAPFSHVSYPTFQDRSRPASLNGPGTELDNSNWWLLLSRACQTCSHDVRRHRAVSAGDERCGRRATKSQEYAVRVRPALSAAAQGST